MRKVHEKSILLGIGIGMIITAVAGIVYSAGSHTELTKDDIISRAKGYGLIEPVKILNNDNEASGSTVAADTSVKNTAANDTSTKASPTKDTAKSGTSTAAASPGEAQKTGTTGSTAGNSKTDTNDSKSSSAGIKITIGKGHISKEVTKQLLAKGIITNEKEFTSVMNSYKASRKIISGTYTFKKNEDLDYLVKTICGIK